MKCNECGGGIISMKEVRVTDPITGGQKGQKDVQLHSIPWPAIREIGKVYAFGARKYEDGNFRKGYRWSLSYDALQRHLWAWWDGEDNDSESSLSHLAHAAWHAINLLFFSLTGRGTDDRYKDETITSKSGATYYKQQPGSRYVPRSESISDKDL